MENYTTFMLSPVCSPLLSIFFLKFIIRLTLGISQSHCTISPHSPLQEGVSPDMSFDCTAREINEQVV